MNSENAENAADCRESKSRRTDSTSCPREARNGIPETGGSQPQPDVSVLLDQLEGYFRAHSDKMVERCRWKGLEDPEGAVQDMFVVLQRRIRMGVLTADMIKYIPRFQAFWMINASISQETRRYRDVLAAETVAESIQVSNSERYNRGLCDEVAVLLSRLTPRHGSVLRQFYLEGRSVLEICEISSESEAAVKSRLYEARMAACVALRRIRRIPELPATLPRANRDIYTRRAQLVTNSSLQ